MSVWDIKLEREEITFGNALVSLYNIKSDVAVAERELVHSHSYYELHTVLRGGHTYTVGSQIVPVKPGEMVIIPPETEHKPIPLRQSGNVAVLAISIKRLAAGADLCGQLIQRLDACAAAPIPVNCRLIDLIEDYRLRCTQPGMRDVLHKKLTACEILVGVFDAVGCGEENCTDSTQVDFDIMLETLVHNSKVSLSEIAERLGYSPRQISRIIQKRYGKSFTRLRKESK